jgi:hypothetical protein
MSSSRNLSLRCLVGDLREPAAELDHVIGHGAVGRAAGEDQLERTCPGPFQIAVRDRAHEHDLELAGAQLAVRAPQAQQMFDELLAIDRHQRIGAFVPLLELRPGMVNVDGRVGCEYCPFKTLVEEATQRFAVAVAQCGGHLRQGEIAEDKTAEMLHILKVLDLFFGQGQLDLLSRGSRCFPWGRSD